MTDLTYHVQNSALTRWGRPDIELDPTNFTPGTTKPTMSNTGVPYGTTLTPWSGDYTASVADATITNLDISGFVIVNANNVTFKNCKFRGRIGFNQAIATSNATGTVYERCTIIPDYPKFYQNGLQGSGYTALRCDISKCCDNIHSANDSNVNIWGCYLHDLSFFDGSTGSDHSSDSRFPGWTHNDNIQILGGSNWDIFGNNMQGFNSQTVGTPGALLTGPPSGTGVGRTYPNYNYTNNITLSIKNSSSTNIAIRYNWFEGSEVHIQAPAQGVGYDTGNSITVTNNRFGLNMKAGYTGNPTNGPFYNVVWTHGVLETLTWDSTNVYDSVSSVPSNLWGTPLSANGDGQAVTTLP